MSKKILLSEVARFQSIAGLRSMSSLKEDMDMESMDSMEEEMEMEDMDMEEDSMNEYDDTNAGTIALGNWALNSYDFVKNIFGNDPQKVGDALIMMASFVPVAGGALGVLISKINKARKGSKEMNASPASSMDENHGGDLSSIVSKINFPKSGNGMAS